MAWQRPPIRATKIPEQLFQNLFLLVGPQTAKALSVDEQMATFFKDVSCYLSQHDYNPPTQVTMTRIIHELQRLQQEHGLSSDLNLLRFTKEESSSCLREVLTALETRVRKNPNENKRIASLYKYLTRQSTGTEFRGLQKAPETLADLCAALMNFAVECDRLTAIVQDLGRAPTTKRHQENLGGGKSGYEKFRDKSASQDPPAETGVHAIQSQKGSSRCQVCNRPNHQSSECSFRPSATPGNVHPLVDQLRGKPFGNSDVAKRLLKAVVEDPQKPGSYKDKPCKSIPFGLTLTKVGERQVLVPTPKGPAHPFREGEAPDSKNKVRFGQNNTEIIPPNEAIPEDISSLFNVKNFPSAETEDQVTARVVDARTGDGERIEVKRILVDSGALNYNFITQSCVNKYKFNSYKLPKPLKTSSIHGIENNTECVYLNITLTYRGKSITLPSRQLVIIKDCPSYDIIIGLNDIRNYNLTEHLREYFTAQEDLVQTTQLVNALSSGGPSERVATVLETRPKPVPTQTGGTLAPGRVDSAINVYPKDLFLDPVDNIDHIEELTEEHPWSRYFNEAVKDPMSIPSAPAGTEGIEEPWKFRVEGTEPDKAALLELLEANRDIFATG